MAVTANVVGIYSAHKALALALAGHDPVPPTFELDGNVVAYFKRTPKFDADCARYDALRPVVVGTKKLGEPISLQDFFAAVEKAKQQ